MRFLMLMIPAVYQNNGGEKPGPGFAPPADMVEKMMAFNERLAQAGALIALDGLQPDTLGARVTYAGGTPKVTDGPFTESKEIVGGYWIIREESLEKAIQWAKEVPALEGDMVEVRQIFEMSEFPEDVQKAAENYPSVKAAVSGVQS